MHRNLLINLLNNYHPADSKEIGYKARMLDFISKHTNCFERELLIGHITASAFILNQDHTQALLLHHKKLDSWFQLGGHCDGDYDVLRVALKEAQEESGINEIAPVSLEIFDIDIHTIPANSKEPEHDHYDIRFLLQVVSDEDVVVSEESHNLAWIDKNRDNLPTNERSVVRMFDKWVGIL